MHAAGRPRRWWRGRRGGSGARSMRHGRGRAARGLLQYGLLAGTPGVGGSACTARGPTSLGSRSVLGSWAPEAEPPIGPTRHLAQTLPERLQVAQTSRPVEAPEGVAVGAALRTNPA